MLTVNPSLSANISVNCIFTSTLQRFMPGEGMKKKNQNSQNREYYNSHSSPAQEKL